MPAKRPTPLTDDIEVSLPRAPGAVLLGRTGASMAEQEFQKKAFLDDASAVGLHAVAGGGRHLTPLGPPSPLGSSRGRYQPLQSSFTPLATPSPWGSRQVQMFYRKDTDDDEGDGQTTVETSPASQEEEEFDDTEDHEHADAMEMQLQMQEQLQKAGSLGGPPAPPPGALHPSVGSAGHASGTCRRCCFFPRGRCANGYDCGFCHYEHEKRKRKANKKRIQKPVLPPRGPLGVFAPPAPATTVGSAPVLLVNSVGGLYAPQPYVGTVGGLCSPQPYQGQVTHPAQTMMMTNSVQMMTARQVFPYGQFVSSAPMLQVAPQQSLLGHSAAASTIGTLGLHLGYSSVGAATASMATQLRTGPGLVTYFA